jgi:hypothetical protein
MQLSINAVISKNKWAVKLTFWGCLVTLLISWIAVPGSIPVAPGLTPISFPHSFFASSQFSIFTPPPGFFEHPTLEPFPMRLFLPKLLDPATLVSFILISHHDYTHRRMGD